MVHCDDRLKHDRLLTLIWLFEYRTTGTRVLMVHDKRTIQGPTIHVSNSLHSSQNSIQTCLFYIYIILYILYIDNSRFKTILA